MEDLKGCNIPSRIAANSAFSSFLKRYHSPLVRHLRKTLCICASILCATLRDLTLQEPNVRGLNAQLFTKVNKRLVGTSLMPIFIYTTSGTSPAQHRK